MKPQRLKYWRDFGSRWGIHAIEQSAQSMAFECEGLPDRSEARRQGLRARCVVTAPHAPRAPPRRRMTILRAGGAPGHRGDEPMLHSGQRRARGFRRRIAAQWNGRDRVRHRVRAQHALEEALGARRVAPLLPQDVEFRTLRVDGAPQQGPLVEVPRATGLAARRFDPAGKARAKRVALATPRRVAHRPPGVTLRSSRNASMSRRLSRKRKSPRTASRMNGAERRGPGAGGRETGNG
ncbi:hypothetical protein PSP31121_05335 [Pandoraea sputorum]|uniref:Uncharacterized protein n=1 Tax=Pandoraea sputorum TaxID=93222 RepID=A0A5E5BIU9_9BURK|nr:hypothetical protein PSP31121_05335 [Pandoraea sputorum]